MYQRRKRKREYKGTNVRIALCIRIITAGQLAKLSRLTFYTFQLISMESHSPSAYSLDRTVSFLQFLFHLTRMFTKILMQLTCINVKKVLSRIIAFTCASLTKWFWLNISEFLLNLTKWIYFRRPHCSISLSNLVIIYLNIQIYIICECIQI